jgi:hypothetical protein
VNHTSLIDELIREFEKDKEWVAEQDRKYAAQQRIMSAAADILARQVDDLAYRVLTEGLGAK